MSAHVLRHRRLIHCVTEQRQFGFGSSPSQDVVVQGTDFLGLLPIDVVVTAERGARTVYPAQIDMQIGVETVTVDLPINGHNVERIELLGEIARKALG